MGDKRLLLFTACHYYKTILYSRVELFLEMWNSEYMAFITLKKKERENTAVWVEGKISLTMYTSATSTVLDCCTNKRRLGESKTFVKWN